MASIDPTVNPTSSSQSVGITPGEVAAAKAKAGAEAVADSMDPYDPTSVLYDPKLVNGTKTNTLEASAAVQADQRNLRNVNFKI